MEIKTVEINNKIIETCKTNDDFMILGLEVAKEFTQYLCIINSMYEYENQVLNNEKAIIRGLMDRVRKLFSSMLDNICQKRLEIVKILTRCLLETIINLEYLITQDDSNRFENFILYSFLIEKKFYEKIEQNILNRGYELEIEKRMKQSIAKALATNNTSIDDLQNKKLKSWAENSIYDRFEKTNYLPMYSAYSLLSHSVHGNWQELLLHHLKTTDNGYVVDEKWHNPDLRSLTPMLIILIRLCKDYLNYEFSHITEIKQFVDALDELKEKVSMLDVAHENFINTTT